MFIPKYIYYLILLSGCIILLIRWKQLDSKIHIIFFLLLFTIITEWLRDILYRGTNVPARQNTSGYIVHIYQPIETLLLLTAKNIPLVKVI